MTERNTRRLGVIAAWVGAAVLLVAGAWWGLAFRQIIVNGYMSAPRALPCLMGESVVCRLAQALCTSDHFLGVRRYHVEIFWVGAGLVAAGLTMRRVVAAKMGEPLPAGGE